jgi:transposase
MCYTEGMRKQYKIAKEDGQTAYQKMKETKRKAAYRRLQVIYLKSEEKNHEEITKVTGYSLKHISKILARYEQEGFDSMQNERRGGANNRKVSAQAEEEFLLSYKERSETGEISTIKEMWLDYQNKFNITMTKEGFYKLLHRHGWRKVMPRTTHPKSADAKTIEASKKLKLPTEKT